MEYDTKKAPLGKITTEQIKAGYQALKDISECITAGKISGGAITQACNDFYTRPVKLDSNGTFIKLTLILWGWMVL